MRQINTLEISRCKKLRSEILRSKKFMSEKLVCFAKIAMADQLNTNISYALLYCFFNVFLVFQLLIIVLGILIHDSKDNVTAHSSFAHG